MYVGYYAHRLLALVACSAILEYLNASDDEL